MAGGARLYAILRVPYLCTREPTPNRRAIARTRCSPLPKLGGLAR